MASRIAFYSLPISELPLFLIEVFKHKYKFEDKYCQTIIEKHFIPHLNNLKEDLWSIIEFPYVDKMYRDTYYHYYASKSKNYDRDTIRLSFFLKETDLERFRGEGDIADLRDSYAGFIIIRPTFPKIIGRSAIAPKALRNNDFLCCTSPIAATVNNIKMKVRAFPHASQDSQAIVCAETTIWSLFEYFGNKYVDYGPILPSQINKILQQYSYKRQVPSEGLTAEQMTYAVRELGFGAMIYSKAKHSNEFHTVLSTFIESGIPIIGVLKNQYYTHAINIIGRETDNREKIAGELRFEDGEGDLKIADYNKIQRKYVFIDDNYPPYQIASLEYPCLYYKDQRWHDCQLTHIIVPLYRKIYLDPIKARRNFLTVLKEIDFFYKNDEAKILKIFLASSRSYKEYIALSPDLDITVKESILAIGMPRFIWVAEISTTEDFIHNRISGLLIQDATEPVDYSDKTYLTDIPVFFGGFKTDLFTYLDGKLEFIHNFASNLEAYKSNLH